MTVFFTYQRCIILCRLLLLLLWFFKMLPFNSELFVRRWCKFSVLAFSFCIDGQSKLKIYCIIETIFLEWKWWICILFLKFQHESEFFYDCSEKVLFIHHLTKSYSQHFWENDILALELGTVWKLLLSLGILWYWFISQLSKQFVLF